MNLIRLSQAVIVEGKYDKIKLSSLLDATVIATDGFRIYKDRQKLELIRLLAKTCGIIIATDSDAAGFQIRSFLKSAVREGEVLHLYLPDIPGKEKRKATPSKEGKLGLEGIPLPVLEQLFSQAGAQINQASAPKTPITKLTLYEDGLTGGPDSRQKRLALLKRLHLPEHLNTNSLLSVLNSLYDYNEYKQIVLSL